MSHTHLDIAYAISVISQFMYSPSDDHMAAFMRIWRYWNPLLKKLLIFGKHGHMEIKGYTDADLAKIVTDRQSTSGYFMFVAGNLVTL